LRSIRMKRAYRMVREGAWGAIRRLASADAYYLRSFVRC
jgi:hypothetical protein